MEKKNYLTSKKKTEIVIELLRGENIEILSRKQEVTASELSQWRDCFILSGENGFKRSPDDSKL